MLSINFPTQKYNARLHPFTPHCDTNGALIIDRGVNENEGTSYCDFTINFTLRNQISRNKNKSNENQSLCNLGATTATIVTDSDL